MSSCPDREADGLLARWRSRRRATAGARQRDKIARARAAAVEELMAEQRAARSGFEAAHRRVEARR